MGPYRTGTNPEAPQVEGPHISVGRKLWRGVEWRVFPPLSDWNVHGWTLCAYLVVSAVSGLTCYAGTCVMGTMTITGPILILTLLCAISVVCMILDREHAVWRRPILRYAQGSKWTHGEGDPHFAGYYSRTLGRRRLWAWQETPDGGRDGREVASWRNNLTVRQEKTEGWGYRKDI